MRTYFILLFYNDIINLKNFELNFLKIDKKHYKGINIFYIGYITIKRIGDCENISSIYLLYLQFNHENEYIEEKNGNKYLIFDDSDNKNKEVFKKYTHVWNGIKNEIEAINGGKEKNDGKDYMKIKFNSDDNLLLNKPLKFHAMTIIVRFAFEEDGNLYLQRFLGDTLYELSVKMLQYERIEVSEGIDVNKKACQKDVCFAIIGILKM